MTTIDLVMHLGTWAQQHPWHILGGAAAVPVLAGASQMIRHRGQRNPTTHGSARWATPREVKRAGLYASRGVICGKLGNRLLRDDSEGHIFLMGPTRKGKGIGVIIPTLLTWRESTLILDPKDGENLKASLHWRAGYTHIHAFTPCTAPHARINVLDTIRLKTPREFADTQLIAQSLTAPEKMAHESATGLHFRELASLLLSAAMLHICYTTTHPSLAGVWAFLTQQHGSLADCLKTMASTAHSSHGVHQAIASMTTAISNISGDRELSSVWTTAIRPLVLYSDPLIAASTDRSTLRLDDLQYAQVPMTLALVAPDPMVLDRLHPLYRVILDVAMMRLMEHPPRSHTHRLLFIGDELPWYGYSRAIDKGIAVMAGYGIKGLLVTQDLPSLEAVYGANHALWGNTDLKIFHAPVNDLTAKRISENLMGKGTMDHPVEQRQGGILGQRSVSLQHVARPLLTTDEVMELDPQYEILRMSGVKPILCRKVDYRREPMLQRRVRM